MLRKIFIGAVLLAPVFTFAEGKGHAYTYVHTKHAPEIDGSNIVLGIAVLGGVPS